MLRCFDSTVPAPKNRLKPGNVAVVPIKTPGTRQMPNITKAVGAKASQERRAIARLH